MWENKIKRSGIAFPATPISKVIYVQVKRNKIKILKCINCKVKSHNPVI